MRVYLFRKYERFWHWAQSALILALVWTGFALHGTFSRPGFETAFGVHRACGLLLLILTVFTMFWHATTGEGRQLVPGTKGLAEQIRFYTGGIFRGAPHPEVASPEEKFNPLQRAAYFALLVLVFPVTFFSGLLLWGMSRLPAIARYSGGVGPLALLHTAGAFAMLVFIVLHLYMITTGRTLAANLAAMVTGWTDSQGTK